jgi:hypothetical protein
MSVGRIAPSSPQVAHAGARPAGASRSLLLRAALVLVLSAALAATLARLTAGTGAPGGGAKSTRSIREIGAVPASEAARFAILRSPHSSADAFVPLRAGSGPFGANPALARAVREPRVGLSSGLVSVVPARGAVCLRVPVGVVLAQWWCQPTAAAARGLLLGAVRPGGPLRASNQLIVGLVPDGVRSVVITAARGVRRRVGVIDNVYDTQIFAPESVSLELPGGRAVRYAAP